MSRGTNGRGLLQKPRGRVPAAWAVYTLFVAMNVNLAGFFALAPTFRDELGLSGTQRDVLFTGTGIVMLVAALPLGSLADRFGARRLTLLSMALLVASALGHAFAVGFWSLLGARLVFAMAFTGMLTAAMAWLADATPEERRARALGGMMPCAGIGLLSGPYLAGALADASGTRLAYLVLAALALVPLALGVLAPSASPSLAERTALRESVVAVRIPVVAAAVVLTTLGIVVDTALNLLVPQQLDDNGLSATARGAVLSAAGAVFVVTALIAVRHAHRLTNLRSAGLVSLLVGLALVPVMLSDGTVAQAVTMVGRSVVLSVLFVIAYPLGTLGANRAGLPLGAAAGLLMLATGAASTAAPLGAGRGADAIGGGALYAIVAAGAVAAGLWMLVLARSEHAKLVASAEVLLASGASALDAPRLSGRRGRAS